MAHYRHRREQLQRSGFQLFARDNKASLAIRANLFSSTRRRYEQPLRTTPQPLCW